MSITKSNQNNRNHANLKQVSNKNNVESSRYKNAFYAHFVICDEQSLLPSLPVRRNFEYASKHVWAVSLSGSMKIRGVCLASHNSVKLQRVLHSNCFPSGDRLGRSRQKWSDGEGLE